jgi:hypothetical protein
VTLGTDEIEEDVGIETAIEEEEEEEESVEATREGIDDALSDRGLFKDWIGVGRGAWRWV